MCVTISLLVFTRVYSLFVCEFINIVIKVVIYSNDFVTFERMNKEYFSEEGGKPLFTLLCPSSFAPSL